MTGSTLTRILIFTICSMIFSATAHATLFDIDLNDLDGSHWLGQVDTTLDKLTITSWVENPGGSLDWTPSSLPLTLLATNSSGSTYDIPDNWDGSISAAWGFLLPVPNASIGWNEGTPGPWHNTTSFGWGAAIDGGALVTAFGVNYIVDVPSGSGLGSGVRIWNSVSITAVPEPSTLMLIGLGFAVLSAGRGRSRGLHQRAIHPGRKL